MSQKWKKDSRDNKPRVHSILKESFHWLDFWVPEGDMGLRFWPSLLTPKEAGLAGFVTPKSWLCLPMTIGKLVTNNPRCFFSYLFRILGVQPVGELFIAVGHVMLAVVGCCRWIWDDQQLLQVTLQEKGERTSIASQNIFVNTCMGANAWVHSCTHTQLLCK